MNNLSSMAQAMRGVRWIPGVVRCTALAAATLAMSHSMAMDLRGAYEAALEHDATVRAARTSAAAGRERVPQARSQLLPNVSLSVARNYNDLESQQPNMFGQTSTLQNTYYSGNKNLSVRQPLYRPQLTASLAQAHAQVKEVEARLDHAEQELVVRVAEAYFDALLAREQVALVAAQKASYAMQLDAARKGFEGGSGTRTDIDDAQARLDMAFAQELEAKQNLDFTQHKLQSITGKTAAELADLAALNVDGFQPTLPVPASLEEWIAMAEDASPEIRTLRAQEEAARLEIDKAQAGHKPTLDAVAYWARTSSDSVTSVNSRHDQKAVGLQLSIPLFSGGYVNSTVRQAVANHESAKETLDATRAQLRVQVHQEFRGVTEGVLRIAALEQAVRSAQQALLSSRKSFEAGARTSVDVLNAEQQKTMALRDLAQARFAYVLSRVKLQALAGQDRWETVNLANEALALSAHTPSQ